MVYDCMDVPEIILVYFIKVQQLKFFIKINKKPFEW